MIKIKNPYSTTGSIPNWTYLADIKNISNTYPYGKSYGANATYDRTEDYRYGFNGMEKAKEVNDNTLTSKYRNADLDFPIWWSRDPEEIRYPDISPYVSMGSNPILYTDTNGDLLDIYNNTYSKNDINSIVMEKNRNFIVMTNNGSEFLNISLNFGTLSKEEIDKRLEEDAGLRLLNKVIEGKKKHLYEATNVVLVRNNDGTKASGFLYYQKDAIQNLSDYGKDSKGSYVYLPRVEYNGQVIMSPNVSFIEKNAFGNEVPKSRASVVFHEIAENYERTELGIDYYTNTNQSRGAHHNANILEGDFWNRSLKPGTVNRFEWSVPAILESNDGKRIENYMESEK